VRERRAGASDREEDIRIDRETFGRAHAVVVRRDEERS